MKPENFWVVDGTRLEGPLHPAVDYGNTAVADVAVRPATEAALEAWFDDEGQRLRPGDTLLFYVTDHGTKNAEDTANNKIVLWGKDAQTLAPRLDGVAQIASPHPSPMAARYGFFGSKPFSRANAALAAQGAVPIDWRLE